jgi:hypothetical protein
VTRNDESLRQPRIREQTAGEALGRHTRFVEDGIGSGAACWPDAPDEMHVAEDGRPIAVYLTAAARHQRDGGA